MEGQFINQPIVSLFKMKSPIITGSQLNMKRFSLIIILYALFCTAYNSSLKASINIYPETFTYGLTGGMEVPFTGFGKDFRYGYSGGIFLAYQPSGDFIRSYLKYRHIFFETSFKYTFNALKNSPLSNMMMFSLDVGPVFYFPIARWFFPYIGGSPGMYFSRLSLDSLENTSTNYGFCIRGKLGFMVPATPSLSLRVEGAYTYSYFKEAPWHSAGVTLGLTYNFSGDLGNRIDKNESPTHISTTGAKELFAIRYLQYNSQGIGKITVRNRGTHTVFNMRVDVMADHIAPGRKSTEEIPELHPGEVKVLTLPISITSDVLSISEKRKIPVRIRVVFGTGSSRFFFDDGFDITVHGKNSLTWDNTAHLGSFIMPRDPTVSLFTRKVLSTSREWKAKGIQKNIMTAMILFNSIKAHGISYVSDPSAGFSQDRGKNSVDYIQLPGETLKKRGGDCDDLTVLYCSMLESVGVPTAIATVPGHVFVLFNTGVPESLSSEISKDKPQYIVRSGIIWIPVEITMLTGTFMEAWDQGMKQTRQNGFEALDTSFAWETCPPSDLGTEIKIARTDMNLLKSHVEKDKQRFIRSVYLDAIARLQQKLKNNKKDYKTWNKLGIAFGRQHLLQKAEESFLKALSIYPAYGNALINMGNVYMLKRNYQKASHYFGKAVLQKPGESRAQIGYARSLYEAGNFKKARTAYRAAVKKRPGLSARYSYIDNKSGSAQGRASDRTGRIEMNVWSD